MYFVSLHFFLVFFFLAIGLVFTSGNLNIYMWLNLLRGSSLIIFLITWFAMWVTMWFPSNLRSLVFLYQQNQHQHPCFISIHTTFDTPYKLYFTLKICLQLNNIVYYNYVKFRVIGHYISDARFPKPRGTPLCLSTQDDLER